MGYKIKEKRTEMGLSQETLAEISGVSRTIISGLESGRKNITTTGTLIKIAKALNLSIEDIFFV